MINLYGDWKASSDIRTRWVTFSTDNVNVTFSKDLVEYCRMSEKGHGLYIAIIGRWGQ